MVLKGWYPVEQSWLSGFSLGTWKRGHYERGLLNGGISRMSRLSRISRKWSVSPLFSRDAAFLLTLGSFLLTVELFYLQLKILAFLLTIGAFLLTILFSLLTVGAFFAYSGKVRLIRALRDCKQRSLTVSKKAPTVSKKAAPVFQAPKRIRNMYVSQVHTPKNIV